MSRSPARTARRPAPGAVRPAGPPRMGWKAAFFGLAVVAIIGGVAWALLGSRLLIVRSVQVTGTGSGSEVSRAQVLAAARIPLGLPLVRVNTAAAAQRVGDLHDVQSVQVSRGWPDSIVISVRLRTPVFAVAVNGGYLLVDAFGVDMRFVAHRPARYPLLTVGSAASAPWPGEAPVAAGGGAAGARGTAGHGKARQPGKSTAPTSGKTPAPPTAHAPAAGAASGTSLRGNPAVRAAAAVLRELPPAIARRVQAVHAPDALDVSVRLTDGVVIVWGDTSRAAEKAKELTLLMRTGARGYDVSAPGAAVTQG